MFHARIDHLAVSAHIVFVFKNNEKKILIGIVNFQVVHFSVYAPLSVGECPYKLLKENQINFTFFLNPVWMQNFRKQEYFFGSNTFQSTFCMMSISWYRTYLKNYRLWNVPWIYKYIYILIRKPFPIKMMKERLVRPLDDTSIHKNDKIHYLENAKCDIWARKQNWSIVFFVFYCCVIKCMRILWR